MTLEFRKAPLQKLMEEPASFTPDNFVLFNSAGDAADSGFGIDGFSASIISRAAAGLTQLGTWNASTNLTDASVSLPTIPLDDIGGFYDVTAAATRFGITWAVNDKIIVAQKPDGTKVWTKQAATGDLFDPSNVYASSGTGTDANSGTVLRPKKTLAAALSVASQPGTIILSAGTYGTVGAALAVAKQNILVIGRGANSSNQCTLSDNLSLNAARFRLRDVNVAGSVTWTDATGGHQLRAVGGLTNFVFAAASTARGFAVISDSDLSSTVSASNITLADLPAGQIATLYLTRVTNARAGVGAGWTLFVTDCKDFQCTSLNATGTLINTDDLPYIGILTTQAELDAAKADATVPSIGYYILGFSGATGVGGAANGDVLYKSYPSVIALHKKYVYAPATVYGPSGKTYYKTAGGWAEIIAPSAGGAATYTEPLVITATGGVSPGIGANPVQNYISLVDDGSGWCTVTGALKMSAAGAAGSGTYLINLPAGKKFDTAFHPINTQTGNLSGGGEVYKIIPGSGGVIGWVDGTATHKLDIVPHSQTQFKLSMSFAINGGSLYYYFQSSNMYQMSSVAFFNFSFRFKKA